MGIVAATTRITGLFFVLWLMIGCADEYMIFHSQSGDPLLISRRGYTSEECLAKVNEDAVRMGVTFRYVHVRGSMAGRSLLWPLEKGFACEAAIGPEQPPTGAYPMGTRILHQGS